MNIFFILWNYIVDLFLKEISVGFGRIVTKKAGNSRLIYIATGALIPGCGS